MRNHQPRRATALAAVLMSLSCSFCFLASVNGAEIRQLSRAELRDKIRGGWAGQMIGVSYGAPTEFRSNAKINETGLKW